MRTSKYKEISLADVVPNPFRRLDLYPLDEAKITKLRSSMNRTDFWDNVVARKKNGNFEIAYGHHRIEAARREFGKTSKVTLIVRDLDDESMLKMMAADNDDAYNLTPAFILETVAAAKGFLEKNGRNVTPVDNPRNKLDVKIAAFLAWPSVRVQQALSQLNAIESGELSKKAVETLPTIHAATTLHRQVKKAKEAGRPITKKKQVEIARKASESADKSPARVIESEAVEEIYSTEEKDSKKTKEFQEYLGETAQAGRKFSKLLDKILDFRDDLESDTYNDTIGAHYLQSVCVEIAGQLAKLYGKEFKNGKKEIKALSA